MGQRDGFSWSGVEAHNPKAEGFEGFEVEAIAFDGVEGVDGMGNGCVIGDEEDAFGEDFEEGAGEPLDDFFAGGFTQGEDFCSVGDGEACGAEEVAAEGAGALDFGLEFHDE